MCFSFFMSFRHSPSVALAVQKDTAERTQKPILLCEEATLSTNYMANSSRAGHLSSANTAVYRKDDPWKSGETHMNS